MAHLEKVFQYIDDNQKLYVKRLSDVVAIQSVSAEAEKRGEVIRMVEHTADELRKLGATAELVDVGKGMSSSRDLCCFTQCFTSPGSIFAI